jgi:phosphoribosylformylglycinamidine synthase
MHDAIGNRVPRVNVEKAKALYRALSKAIGAGLVASCHDCSDGGAGIAIAETAFAGGLGMLIKLALFPASGIHRNDTLLFSESQSRFVVTISPSAKKSFEATMKGIAMGQVGEVLADGLLKIDGLDGRRIVEEDINVLKAAWQRPLNF